jgi:mannose-1-phosphate guanylyltransferase
METFADSHLWAIVLAGGDGVRVSRLTQREYGEPVPKQYCSFGTGEPMVRWAVRRALAVCPRSRVLAVVAEGHRRFWQRDLPDLEADNLIVQPRNRGTAAGILLPVLDVMLRRDRDARFLVLPSDHHVPDERVLRRSLLAAAQSVRAPDAPLVLLGVTPADDDAEYGWVLPAAGSASRPRCVLSFHEKPDRATHQGLLRLGGLISSFIFAARGQSLLALYEDALPGLVRRFVPLVLESRPAGRTAALYDEIPARDFSRAVLERSEGSLVVLAVPPCGWSDLGTPARLQRFLDAPDDRSAAASGRPSLPAHSALP